MKASRKFGICWLCRLAMLHRAKTTRTMYAELADQANWCKVRAAMRHLGDLSATILATQLGI